MIESIRYEEVTSISQDIMNSAGKMENILTDTKQAMAPVGNDEGVWKSDAAVSYKNKFDSLATKFQDFYLAIQNYSKFLDETVIAYKAAEQAITSAADDSLAS